MKIIFHFHYASTRCYEILHIAPFNLKHGCKFPFNILSIVGAPVLTASKTSLTPNHPHGKKNHQC